MKTKRNKRKNACYISAGLLVLLALENLLLGLRHIGIVLLIVLAGALALLPVLLTKPKKKFLYWAVRLMYGLAAVVFILFSAYMAFRAWGTSPPTSSPPDYAIVLGSQIRGDSPGGILRRRLDKAVKYLNANPDTHCIVSGGQGADEIMPEAVAMHKYLVDKGIDSQRILQEDQSTNTRQNLALSRQLLPEDYDGGLVIITDSFHQARAAITAQTLDFGPIYAVSCYTAIDLLPGYWLRDLAGLVPTWLEEVHDIVLFA